jgi:glutathione S-transferase
MAAKPKLTYFNVRGRGEIIRLVFAAAGAEYTDNRIERETWPTLKAGTPFGQLPILEIDGKTLCQSNAIARYVARKHKLAGHTELESAQVDMTIDCFEDSTKPILQFFFEKDEAKKGELKKKYLEEQLPQFLTQLENLLKQNHGGDKFFVGTELTWADLAFITFVGWTALAAGGADTLTKHPKLKALKDRVEALPKIKAWLESRPKTDM